MRIYCDTTFIVSVKREWLEDIIKAGNVLVFSNTAIDCKILQNNAKWARKMLMAGNIRIEMLETLDEMVSKPFFWSSCNITTPACNNFDEALWRYIPENANPEKIRALAELIKDFGIKRGNWLEEKIDIKDVISQKLQKRFFKNLEIDIYSTPRTEIYKLAEEKHFLKSYFEYNFAYSEFIARQHGCCSILENDASIYVFPSLSVKNSSKKFETVKSSTSVNPGEEVVENSKPFLGKGNKSMQKGNEKDSKKSSGVQKKVRGTLLVKKSKNNDSEILPELTKTKAKNGKKLKSNSEKIQIAEKKELLKTQNVNQTTSSDSSENNVFEEKEIKTEILQPNVLEDTADETDFTENLEIVEMLDDIRK